MALNAIPTISIKCILNFSIKYLIDFLAEEILRLYRREEVGEMYRTLTEYLTTNTRLNRMRKYRSEE